MGKGCQGWYVIPFANSLAISVVPVLFKGRIESVSEIRKFVERAHSEPSVLGGQREVS